MNRKVAMIALVLLIGYWFVSWQFSDWSIPIFELPIIGPIVDVKPFQLLAPWSLFIGGGIVFLIAYAYRRKQK